MIKAIVIKAIVIKVMVIKVIVAFADICLLFGLEPFEQRSIFVCIFIVINFNK